MLIVNQRNDRAVDIANINAIEIQEKTFYEHMIFAMYKDGALGYGLGTYEADRAKQVFREILTAYANGNKVFFMPEN